MKLIRLQVCILLTFASNNCFPQQVLRDSTPISRAAFNRQIMKDLNFMVLGENNVKQGFSYENKEKNTELILSANIANLKRSIITMDGEFAVDGGTYIFDENDGSKKSKFNVNFFFPIKLLTSKFFPATNTRMHPVSEIKRIERLRLVRNEEQTAIEDLLEFEAILNEFGIPHRQLRVRNPNDNLIQFSHTWFTTGNYLRQYYPQYLEHSGRRLEDSIVSKLGKKYLENKARYIIAGEGDSAYSNTFRRLRSDRYVRYEIHLNSYTVPADLKLDLFLKDYEAAVIRVQNLHETTMDIEINNFKYVWTSQKTSYVGISPYYERQQLDIYNGISNPTFTEMFDSTYGDAYGLRGSLNMVWDYLSGGYFVFRGLASVGRNTNISDFSKKDYSRSLVDGAGITTTDKATAYVNKFDEPFQYGFIQEFNFEGYLSSKYMGVFGRIGYKKNDALNDMEKWPLETGLLINLKSDKKNIVGLQLFISRNDLNEHPDDDMNFGFKIGLPISIEKRGDHKFDVAKSESK